MKTIEQINALSDEELYLYYLECENRDDGEAEQELIEKIKNYFTTHYRDINKQSFLSENIEQLREIELLQEDWDGEGGLAFGKEFIQEVMDLVSTLQTQPDLGPTGRGSIQLEYGSRKAGKRYLGLEIFELNRIVKVYVKDEAGNRQHEEIRMEDINGRVQQF